MIYKIYTFQYEANKFLYGLGKGHQQYTTINRCENAFEIFVLLIIPIIIYHYTQYSSPFPP